MPYTPFFDKFPKIKYDMNHSKIDAQFETVTNIFFRVAVIKETLNNLSSYHVYELDDGDTPEILAEKVYNDAGANWIIIYANKILDPQFDWPLDYDSFNKYIIGKYGSIEAAKTKIHHYEKLVTRTIDSIVSTQKFPLDKSISTNGVLTLVNTHGSFTIGEHAFTGNSSQVYANADFKGTVVSWSSGNGQLVLSNTNGELVINTIIKGNTSGANGEISVSPYTVAPYDTYDNLEYSYKTINVNGKTIIEEIDKNMVDCYTWEDEQNENRKLIKVIKSDYYAKIMDEFDNLTKSSSSYLRRVF